MNDDIKYPELFQGYFDHRGPFTENLEAIYECAVVIPIYHIDEMFNEQAIFDVQRMNKIADDPACKAESAQLSARLMERDLHIFTYFHFIAAQQYVLHELKNLYRDFYELEQTLKQFEAKGFDVSKARGTDLVKRKKALLDFQARLCDRQFA